MPTSEKPTRRDFLSRFILGYFVAALLPALYVVIEYLIPPRIREKLMDKFLVGKVSDIPIGTAKIVKFNKKAVIIVHGERDQFKAFSAVCTHLGCIVEYNGVNRNFKCNCHGSVFNLEGKNVAGPAPLPLKPYRAVVKNDEITVSEI